MATPTRTSHRCLCFVFWCLIVDRNIASVHPIFYQRSILQSRTTGIIESVTGRSDCVRGDNEKEGRLGGGGRQLRTTEQQSYMFRQSLFRTTQSMGMIRERMSIGKVTSWRTDIGKRRIHRMLQRTSFAAPKTVGSVNNVENTGLQNSRFAFVCGLPKPSSVIDPLCEGRSMSPLAPVQLQQPHLRRLYHAASTIVTDLSPPNDPIDSLFSPPEPTTKTKPCDIDPYWKPYLHAITKPSAQTLLSQLSPACPMGYDPSATPVTSYATTTTSKTSNTTAGKKGSLLSYVRHQKSLRPNCVILTRVGEFYECFGTDAILLVEHCGLNPMGGKARAGCPVKNVQPTLDGLTSVGLRVAVYEEAKDTDSSPGGGAGSAAAMGSSSGGGNSSGNGRRGTTARIKHRMLAQIVSPANPVYLYDRVLDDEFGSRDALYGHSSSLSSPSSSYARPYVGILSTTGSGYTYVEIIDSERTVRVEERMTAEAVACRLAGYPPADPLWYVPSGAEAAAVVSSSPTSSGSRQYTLSFLPSRWDRDRAGPGSRTTVEVLSPPGLYLPEITGGVSSERRAADCILSVLLRRELNVWNGEDEEEEQVETKNEEEGGDIEGYEEGRTRMEQRRLQPNDFTLLSSSFSDTTQTQTHTRPLHLETATQLGLMSDPSVPLLVPSLLPDLAPAHARRFLRRWLLTPPPPSVADAMRDLVRVLKEGTTVVGALPPMIVPPVGKVLSLVRAGQASAQVFRDVKASLEAVVSLLDLRPPRNSPSISSDNNNNNEVIHEMIDPLLTILRHESGIDARAPDLRRRCLDAIRVIDDVVVDRPGRDAFDFVRGGNGDYEDAVPAAFFERNEASWRGRTRVDAMGVKEAYGKVKKASNRLVECVAEDFWGGSTKTTTATKAKTKSPVVQDIFNNLIAIKEIPSWAKGKTDKDDYYFHPRDRNGKILRNRYTTTNVRDALTDYISACDEASAAVADALSRLSEQLCDDGHLPAVAQAAHTNLVLSTASHHAAHANAMGWGIATVTEDGPFLSDDNADDGLEGTAVEQISGRFDKIFPYWMNPAEATRNSFTLSGLFLLTAPNMSGKSTLMRSTAAAALISACGLAAPLSSTSIIRRFDSLFVRGASSDVPSENKSAFGAEMEDVSATLREGGDRSLVFLDELGRGTSPKDGVGLAGAVLEAMAKMGMGGMFATHLHPVLDLPFCKQAKRRIRRKKMGVENRDGNADGSGEDVKWTYRIVDGVCTDSLALVTAARFGVPQAVLERARELSSETVSMRLGIKQSHYDPNNDKQTTDTPEATPCLHNSEDAANVMEAVCGGATPVHIPPGWTPPPFLEGASCVYLLSVSGDSGEAYYVGETDSFSRRLRTHRSRRKGDEWADVDAYVVPVPGGKSAARGMEAALIRKLVKEGFKLVSVTDGQRRAGRSGGGV